MGAKDAILSAGRHKHAVSSDLLLSFSLSLSPEVKKSRSVPGPVRGRCSRSSRS